MRYFLHVVTDKRFIRDPDGTEFSGIAEAEAEAAQSARDLMSDELRRGRSIPNGWRMLIATEDDTILKTIHFLAVANGTNPDHEPIAPTKVSPAQGAPGIRVVDPRKARSAPVVRRHPNEDGEWEHRQLAKADALIAKARTCIEVQRARIAILESDGRDTSLADDLLRHLEKTLQCMMERRRVIIKQLAWLEE